MLKHAASAAASISSGFDPVPDSNRELNEYSALSPVDVLNVPVPPLSPPSQRALALRVGILEILVSLQLSKFGLPYALQRGLTTRYIGH
jgi:hypothetical protein